MNRLSITSATNPRLKRVLQLHEGRERRELGLYLVEGKREIERYLAALHSQKVSHAHPDGLEELYVSQTALADLENQAILQSHHIHQVIILPDSIFAKISLRESVDGLLAVAKQHVLNASMLPACASYRLLVAQSLEKPGNLGALLRVADAVGARAVVLCERSIEIWNPNVIRASMGSFFHVPTLEMSSEDFMEWAKTESVQLVAAFPLAKTLYTEVAYRERAALVVGAEDVGLSEIWKGQSVDQIRLPMIGMADSLNVSTAAAVCLYEILRQHQASGWV